MHILTNTQATLDVVFDAGYADAAVIVTVTDAAARQIATGNATKDNGTAGRYTFALPPQPNVASLTVTWAATWGGVEQQYETDAEVVASQLCTLGQLRDFDDQKLGNTTAFPDELIAAKRDEITDFFEQICNVSFVRRYAMDVIEGDWRRFAYLLKRRPTKLLAVTVNGETLSSDLVAAIVMYDSGKLERPTFWPWNPVSGRNIVVEYEHGWKVPPAKIVQAAKVLARYDLVTADLGDRTLSVSNDLGVVRLSVPGSKYPTGIPIVDATLEQYDETSDIEAF